MVSFLVLLTAVPLAAVTVPDTISSVAGQALHDLGFAPTDGVRGADLMRATGLAVPGLLAGVPLGAIGARRLPAWAVALGGLAVVGAGEICALWASSIALVGGVRVAEGLGAGLVLPAALVVAWRHPALRAVWAALLVASLLLATPLMLVTLPAAASAWRSVLQPGLLEIGAALVATALWGAVRGRRRREGLPAFRPAERTQLLLPLVPAVGFAVLAVVTSYDWSEGARYVVAAIGLSALLGLAVVGTRDSTTGSRYGVAVVMVTVGVFGMQVVTPLAGLLSTTAGPRHVTLVPFALGAAGALCGAPAGWLLYGRSGQNGLGLVLSGHGLVTVAVMVFLATGSTSGTATLSVPLALLGAGLGMALTASLREASLGATLFALGLLFPALLTGQLVVGTLQVARVNAALAHGGGLQSVPDALTGAFREWLIVAGIVAVVLAGTVALATRRPRASARTSKPSRSSSTGSTPAAGSTPKESATRRAGSAPRDSATRRADSAPRDSGARGAGSALSDGGTPRAGGAPGDSGTGGGDSASGAGRTRGAGGTPRVPAPRGSAIDGSPAKAT